MYGYILPDGTYFERDNEPTEEFLEEFPDPEGTISVPARPDFYYNWDSETSVWVLDEEQKADWFARVARDDRYEIFRKKVDPLVTNPLRWADVPEEDRTAIQEYRIALLNISDQEGWPYEIEWPEVPPYLQGIGD